MTRTRTLALAAACTLTGAGGAFAVDTISSSAHMGRHHMRGLHFAPGFFLGRAVHADATLATRDGLKNLTYDRGLVKSVSGQDLTLTEGTKTDNKDVTLTIPSDAKIRVAGVDNATLSDVKEGFKAVVVSLGGKTVVFAHAPRTEMHP